MPRFAKRDFNYCKTSSKAPHKINVKKCKYFKENTDMLLMCSFWICSTTIYTEKKIIEILKMERYAGKRCKREKKIKLAGFPSPLCRKQEEQA